MLEEQTKNGLDEIILQTSTMAKKIANKEDLQTKTYEKKESIANVIGSSYVSFLGRGYEELLKTIKGGENLVTNNKKTGSKIHYSQIPIRLDKYENRAIEKTSHDV